MPIRKYTSADLAALRALHAAQNFDYAFPDLADPLFVTKLVLENPQKTSSAGAPTEPDNSLNRSSMPAASQQAQAESSANESIARLPTGPGHRSAPSGSISAAVLLRLTSEAYLLIDPHSGTPQERWERIVALQAAAAHDAYAKGLSDVHCWLPPRIARTFGRRLATLGWRRDDTWTPFCKHISGRDT